MSSVSNSPNPPEPSRPITPQVVYEVPRREVPTRVILEQRGAGRWLGRLAWIGLAIAILIIMGLIGSWHSYFQTNPDIQEKYHSLSRLAADKVAIITIEGTIMHTDDFNKWQIDRVREDDAVKAIVVRVDSPGGTVTGSNYIYHYLKKVAAEKNIPVVVSMGGIAASGGYYVSMAVDKAENSIFAEPTTWTGSIGVIIPHYDLSELLASWEIKDDSIASGPLKQMGSPTRLAPPEIKEQERKVLQELVDESFNDFKTIVRSGRPNLTEENMAKATTGQIFTAKQALELGLVDKLGYIEDAIDRSIELAGLNRDNVRAVKYTKPKGLLDDALFGPGGQSHANLAALLDLTAPRAYYLCTWLPGVMVNQPR